MEFSSQELKTSFYKKNIFILGKVPADYLNLSLADISQTCYNS